jgi:hypothetical protein
LEPRENRFHNAVLARYLSLLLYRSQGDVDDARIDRESMEEAWQSQAQIYNFPKPEFPLEEAPDDKALVNILTFTGLSPVKLADTLYLTTGPGVVYIAMTGQSEDYVTDMWASTSCRCRESRAASISRSSFPVSPNGDPT